MSAPSEVPQRILIIEDHPDVADIQRLLCQMEGYDVRVAKSGDEGWKEIHEFAPDLILLDLMLPGSISGNDILHKIQQEHGLGGPAVLVISALINEATAQRLQSYTNVETMKKPFRVTELAAKIHEILVAAPAIR